jgi:Mitochondrial carrier protein.
MVDTPKSVVPSKFSFEKYKHLKNLISPMVGTTVAELVMVPICTLKTNYQNTNLSLFETFKQIYKRDGIKAFYASSYQSCISQILTTTSKYFLYRTLTEKYNVFISGLISGISVSLATHPFDVVRVHRQMGILTNKFWLENPKVLYRGYSKTLLKTSFAAILYLPMYDTFKSRMSPFYASLASSIVSSLVLCPIDYLKTRHVYGLKLFESKNPLNYYRGLSLYLLRIVPHFTITMAVIEQVNKLFMLRT